MTIDQSRDSAHKKEEVKKRKKEKKKRKGEERREEKKKGKRPSPWIKEGEAPKYVFFP